MASKGPARVLYLVRSPSVDDGLDEDAQVFPGLPGLVALQADPQAGRARFVEGDLIHQLLPAVLQKQTASLFTFLKKKNRKKNRGEERPSAEDFHLSSDFS